MPLANQSIYETEKLAEYLLGHGADVTIRSGKDRLTAYEIAISEDGHLRIMHALVGKGISPASSGGILRS